MYYATIQGLTFLVRSFDYIGQLPDGLLYCFIDENEFVYYVGITGEGEDRFCRHHRLAQARNLGATHLAWFEVSSKQTRRAAELLLRNACDPPVNREPLSRPETLAKAAVRISRTVGVPRQPNALRDLPPPPEPRNAFAPQGLSRLPTPRNALADANGPSMFTEEQRQRLLEVIKAWRRST